MYWVENLSRQVRLEGGDETPIMRTSILGRSTRGMAVKQETQEVDGDQLVRLHPPNLSMSGGPAPGDHREVERQGPAIFDPAPMEGDEEDIASDLILLSVNVEVAKEGKSRSDVRMLAICWASGRVDLGVDTQKVKGKWVQPVGSRVSHSP